MNAVFGFFSMVGAIRGDFPVELILAVILAVIVFVLFITLVKRYKRCPSNRILVVFGKTGKGVAKCVHGGAAFVWPVIQSYAWLDLEPFVVPIELKSALSRENIRVSVPTTVTAAISSDPSLMRNAAVRLLGLTGNEIRKQAEDIILGQMRAVIATMGIEAINRDRQAFMMKVNEAVSGELEKIGLAVINVNIKDIEDESGYIEALGRKAAAEAINQALVDVAEEEKLGQTGVAEREKDMRVAVAAAKASAAVGEADADRERRQKVAILEAKAVETETEAEASKAGYRASQKVAEEAAREKGQSSEMMADGAIRVAKEEAQKQAEEARAKREESRLKAEIVVPAEAQKQKIVISAEAEREKAIRIAKGQAEAVVLNMEAEAKGTQAILDAKAAGYESLVNACGNEGSLTAALLLIEKLIDVAGIQAQAIQDLPIEKVIVWDGGGEGGMKNLGQRLMGTVPPMHDLAKMVGLELPEFLGKAVADKQSAKEEKPVSGSEGKTENK